MLKKLMLSGPFSKFRLPGPQLILLNFVIDSPLVAF
jgi:hypothetical protein